MPYPDRISLFQSGELMKSAEELPFQVVLAGLDLPERGIHVTDPFLDIALPVLQRFQRFGVRLGA